MNCDPPASDTHEEEGHFTGSGEAPRCRNGNPWSNAVPEVREWPEKFAALGLDGLYVEGEAPRVLDARTRPEGAHSERLLGELIAQERITQLWLHPSWCMAAGLPACSDKSANEGIEHPFTAGEWNREWTIAKAGLLTPWLKFYRSGERGTVAISIPHLDSRVSWDEAPDARTLLAAILAYREATGGFAYRSGPGATSCGMLAKLHRDSNLGLDLAASLMPEDFPPPARQPGLTPQFAWLRPLTETERANGRYVHAYDKNGMFLAATSSLACGFGIPAQFSPAPVFDKARAGYWLARVTFPDGLKWRDLPHPCYTGPKQKNPANNFHWYTTPTLSLAAEFGARIKASEVWLYPETHLPFVPWYRRLRDARTSLTDGAAAGDVAAGVALGAIKSTYTQGIGWLDLGALRDRAESEDLYRPDWRHAVIAKANADLWRNLAKCATGGRSPFAISTDAVYFVSAEPDPIKAAPPLRMGDGLGQYKVALAGLPLEALDPVWELAAAGRPAGRQFREFITITAAAKREE